MTPDKHPCREWRWVSPPCPHCIFCTRSRHLKLPYGKERFQLPCCLDFPNSLTSTAIIHNPDPRQHWSGVFSSSKYLHWCSFTIHISICKMYLYSTSKHGFPTNTVSHRSPCFLSPEPDLHGLRRTWIATKVFLSISICDTSNGSRPREVHIPKKKDISSHAISRKRFPNTLVIDRPQYCAVKRASGEDVVSCTSDSEWVVQ